MSQYELSGHRVDLPWPSVQGPEEHRIAWSFYLRVTTHASLCGRLDEADGLAPSLALVAEALGDLERFAGDLRGWAEACGPRIGEAEACPQTSELGLHLVRVHEIVLRPFLDRWRVPFLHWWQGRGVRLSRPWLEETHYPFHRALCREWGAVQVFLRRTAEQIAKQQDFPPCLDVLPPAARRTWLEETERIWGEVSR